MEQIKVNMIPNNEVKTIHCSKGDGKTRKWGFELYKEDGIIPSSSISPQMFFDSYKGGTEQILPENTSVPTTSPIIADIQYKDALRSEQEFLYRESPATVDGKAKITKIKGNTLVWNQLIQNGNFADGTNGWARVYAGTISASNNVLTYTNNSGQTINDWQTEVRTPTFSVPSGHLIYCAYSIKPNNLNGKGSNIAVSPSGNVAINFSPSTPPQNVWTRMTFLGSFDREITNLSIRMFGVSVPDGYTSDMKDFILVDLTQLNSSAIIDAQSFRSYYNLPYYDYTQGKLLPFKGESLKTTGKNLADLTVYKQNYVLASDGTETPASYYAITNKVRITGGNYYTFSFEQREGDQTDALRVGFYDGGLNFVQRYEVYWVSKKLTIQVPSNAEYFRLSYKNVNPCLLDIQAEVGETQTSYEPYTTSTLSLPISTYFPTGMKSAGTVYDELTENKAYTRVGSVDLGTLRWGYSAETHHRFYADVTSLGIKTVANDEVGNVVVAGYVTTSRNNITNANMRLSVTKSGGTSYIALTNDAYSSDNAFKTAMSGVYLYYELATPTEASIQTASLVSENVEIPLYEDNDILVGECDELLSAESGFVPVKVKYQDDETVYSQKINLHVEKQI